MLVQNISNYFDANLHKMLVGRRDDAAVMGAYSLSSELATMPSSELLQPLNRVLFPAFVAVKSDLAELKRLFLMAQSLQVMVALPAAVFLSVMSREAVLVLLGEKWLASAPLLQTLALAAAAGAVSVSAWYVGVALGRERSSALLACAQVLLFLALVFLAFPQSKAQDIANLRVVVASVGLVAQLWIVSNALGNIRAWEMLVGLWRSLVSVAIATAAIEALQLPGLGAFLTLLVKGAAFSLLYVFVVWGLWRTSGRPEGAERYLADTAKATLRRLTHRPN
jgi:O-antigen/teichoic acid export membrane protein